jgi:glycosyltransferase involved in cell wall biosynthesis
MPGSTAAATQGGHNHASPAGGNAPLRVLYLHHAGVYGGASRSLLEMLGAFPPGAVAAHAVVPHGRVADMLEAAGVQVLRARGIAQFDVTRYGHYRGSRWLILLREAAYMLPTIAALREAARRWPDIEIVHVNDTTQAPGIALAKRLFDARLVVHVRALLAGTAAPRRMRWLAGLLTRHADAVIAIDETVRATLPPGIVADVVHNGFAPGLVAREGGTSPLAHLSRSSFKVAMVGSLSPMKGVYELVEAARIVVGQGLDVEFVLVGDEVRQVAGLRGWLLRLLGFARPVRAEIEQRVADYGLAGRVHFVGFTTEIKAIYDAIDVICFPSHLDAPGRPVFEAAFSGVPGIVAVRNPTPDTLIDGETGLCIPARDPQALADAIGRLARDRAETKRMGANAHRLALENFDVRRNAGRVLGIYRRVLGRADEGARSCAS